MMQHCEHIPMVSVAMIAYNKERLIARAIEGVVRQRAPFAIELIIVDDASTDATLGVARMWQERYPEIIKVFANKTNLGLQANYIEAFSHCTGKYLAICDADDYWCSPSKLRRQVQYMEKNPGCAITFHRVINHYTADSTKSLSNGGQSVDTTIADLARSNYITNLSVVYRRSLVDLRNLPEWLADDRSPDYAMHMLYAAWGTIHYFRRPMGVYHIAGEGAWSMTERYRRLEMSLSVRHRLMVHFAHMPEVVAGLRGAAESILLAMVAASGNDTVRRDSAIALLMADNPSATPEDIIRAATSKASAPPLLCRLLTAIRRAVSRLVPISAARLIP